MEADDRIYMIVARSRNGVIGSGGGIPWRLQGDLRFFKEMTTGHTVVMGRKTFQSIGRPLPHRKNVVITSDPDFHADGVAVVHSPREALVTPRQGRLFVIGGGTVYNALLSATDVIFVTVVDADVEGDTHFPRLGPEWVFTELHRQAADEHNEYAFTVYRAEKRELL